MVYIVGILDNLDPSESESSCCVLTACMLSASYVAFSFSVFMVRLPMVLEVVELAFQL